MSSTAVATLTSAKDYAITRHSADDLRELMEANLGDVQLSLFNLPRIKIMPGGVGLFKYVGDEGVPKTAETLQGVLVFKRPFRSYWSKQGDGVGGPPDCSSEDAKTGHGNPGGSCRTCQFAQWDTGKNGKGQACKRQEGVLFIRPTKLFPDFLSLPPTSLPAFQQYMIGLMSSNHKYWRIVTEISLTNKKNDAGEYSVAQFKPVESIPADVHGYYDALHSAMVAAFEVGKGSFVPKSDEDVE